MALTGGYDVCVQLSIEVVREIFHLALKQEDRFPHNFGPFTRMFSVPGASPLTAHVRVRLYDEVERAADLRFSSVNTLTFTFPVDLDIELEDSPDPELSHVVLAAVIEVPGTLARLDPSVADGPAAIGVHFAGISANQVSVLHFSGLPAVDSAMLTRAFHHAYETRALPHQSTMSGLTLTVYDGARDNSLSPPNITGQEISAVLEAGDWVRIELPMHLQGSTSGIEVNSYGTIRVFRRLVRTSEAIVLKLSETPAASDTSHATVAALSDVPQLSAASVEGALHDAYAANLLPHSQSLGGNTIQFYDGVLDPLLEPQYPGNPPITGTIETAGSKTFLHIQIPCWAYIDAFTLESFGTTHIHREILAVGTNVEINFALVPSEADRKTRFDMDVASLNGPLGMYAFQIDSALASIGTISRPSPAGAIAAGVAQAVDAYLSARGDIAEAAPDNARAIELIQDGAAEYLRDQLFPIYTPDPGENDVEISEPTARLLVADEIMALQFTPRAGESQEVPDNFLAGSGSTRMALAVGPALLMEQVQDAINTTFPNLHTEQGDLIEEITNRNVWLKSVSVTPADGHFDVSGSATVEVCCWKDPDVEFSGPFYLNAVHEVTPIGNCLIRVEGEAGDFDISMSSSDIALAVLVPIVGWIAGAVIASAIDSVGGGIIEAVAEGQEETIQPIPPVVFGIAAVSSCLTDIRIRSNGLVFPGQVATTRLDRSFEELEDDRRQPNGGDE